MGTYCGKNCEECTYKTELSCSGCQSGPGRAISGDCKLAHCCRDKGHETCETCALKKNCGKWLDKGSIPRQRIERKNEEKAQNELINKRAPFLGKWLWVLFWLIIAIMIFSYVTEDRVLALIPALELPGQIGYYVCQISYASILLIISKEHPFYKTAGILNGICLAINVVSSFLGETMWLLLLIAVTQITVVLMADYYEYKANADVVLVVDGGISEQWENFWNWNVYSFIGIAVSFFLIFLIPFLGTITILVSAIALIVARIKKIICMYRSSQAFRSQTQ